MLDERKQVSAIVITRVAVTIRCAADLTVQLAPRE